MNLAKRHILKTWPEFFDAIAQGRKTFEVRLNDRGYRVGDVLELRRYEPKTDHYTGECIERQITYMLEGGAFGVDLGYAVLAIQ